VCYIYSSVEIQFRKHINGNAKTMLLQYTAAEFKFGIGSKYSVNGRIFAMIFGYTVSVLIWADSLQVSLIVFKGKKKRRAKDCHEATSSIIHLTPLFLSFSFFTCFSQEANIKCWKEFFVAAWDKFNSLHFHKLKGFVFFSLSITVHV